MNSHSYFISDLHLFSQRSRADRHIDAIFRAAACAHTMILGGDIFDFKWSTRSSVEDTAGAAVDWLTRLVEAHPGCTFHFVLGNHDSHPVFVEKLSAFADGRQHFSWHTYFVRLDDCLFLHGDVADRTMNQQQLAARRRRWESHARRGRFASGLYDVAIAARLHRAAAALVHRHRAVARRITSYLNDIGHGAHNGLKHVYFGHTHRQMAGFPYAGLTFHNGGAPITGLPFRIVPTQLARERPHERLAGT